MVNKNHIARFFFLDLFLLSLNLCFAQCPSNIDFEKGNFTGWQCFIGTISAENPGLPAIIILNPSPPMASRHFMLSAVPGDGADPWGGFPQNCPNGSGHSIRLGNDLVDRQAERVSFTFTVPAGADKYSLIYNYAVVLEDPGHPHEQQPRLSIEVLNVTDNVIDPCASFDFVIDANLPGFMTAPMHRLDSVPIRYKDWSSAYINLDGNAGKTFRISFTTTDCSKGAHFGYAYVDINTQCGITDFGSVFCPDDKFVNLSAPPGFRDYKWFNAANQVLGTTKDLTISPVPHNGDSVFVQITPYNGIACADTLVAYFWDTLKMKAYAGPDREFCADTSIRLGEAPRPNWVYQWSPASLVTDPAIANPAPLAYRTTDYLLTVHNIGGGCISSDTVRIVKKCRDIDVYVPTAFTPNGDGKNDRLRPGLYGFLKLNYFRIYNRYGQLLYTMSGSMNGWDGTIHGKPANTQTVVWMLEAVDGYGNIHHEQGTTILLR